MDNPNPKDPIMHPMMQTFLQSNLLTKAPATGHANLWNTVSNDPAHDIVDRFESNSSIKQLIQTIASGNGNKNESIVCH